MLGVFAAGRILNAKTARSQLIGGMIWGVSAALHEDTVLDPRFGAFITQDLANYHVPVHADIGEVDAVMLDEFDAHANVLGSKGVGELGISGAGAAWPTPSTTPAAPGCATIRLRWTKCCRS